MTDKMDTRLQIAAMFAAFDHEPSLEIDTQAKWALEMADALIAEHERTKPKGLDMSVTPRPKPPQDQPLAGVCQVDVVIYPGSRSRLKGKARSRACLAPLPCPDHEKPDLPLAWVVLVKAWEKAAGPKNWCLPDVHTGQMIIWVNRYKWFIHPGFGAAIAGGVEPSTEQAKAAALAKARELGATGGPE